MSRTRKFQMVMNDEIRRLLNDLKERTRRENLTTVIKDALIVYDWVVSEYEKGNEVLSQPDPVGRRRFTVLSFKKKADETLKS